MSDDALVSVIIPTYNRAHIIGRAIESVLKQTHTNFELIIIDDGSTDNTAEVVKSFDDERIKYIKHERNKGVATARNTGIGVSGGSYIAFQDSDDEWLPQKLEKQMAAFKNASPKTGIVYSGCLRISGSKKTYIHPPVTTPKEGDIHNSLLAGNFVTSQALIIKRECFEKAGMFNDEYVALEDWELWLRISKYYHFKYINEPLVISYQMPDSLLANQNAFIRGYELILERHSQDIKKNKRVLFDHCLTIGHLLCSNGELSRGRNYLIKALKAYPISITGLGLALASLLGQKAYNRTAASSLKIGRWFSKG
jgi:glycosyltransferase involved in cell wall biosynthesis